MCKSRSPSGSADATDSSDWAYEPGRRTRERPKLIKAQEADGIVVKAPKRDAVDYIVAIMVGRAFTVTEDGCPSTVKGDAMSRIAA